MYLVTFITLYIIACTYNCVKHFTRLTDARHALAHLDNNAKVRVNVTHLHILGSTASKLIDILWATIIWIISINIWENHSVSINMASVGGCYVHTRFNTFIYGKIQFTMAFCIQVPLVYSHFVDFTLAITLYNYCTTAMSTFTFSDTYKYRMYPVKSKLKYLDPGPADKNIGSVEQRSK